MNKQSKLSAAILNGSLLAFMLFVVYVLYINLEVLYTAHDRSEFLFGAPFFHTLMSKPFGLMRYVGAWLTQLCYKPSLGASVMIAIWMLIFYVGAKAFRLQGSASALMLLPVACLLVSVVDLGYWIYISTIRGYWFSQSVAYLLMLLLLWAARCTPRKWHLAWYVVGFCLYPVLGWFALLFVLCLVLSEKLTWRELLGIILLLFTAAIWHTQFYSNLKFDDVMMAGFPRFITPSDSSPHLSTPFWVLGAVSLFISLYRNFEDRFLTKAQAKKWLIGQTTLFIPVLCVVAGIIFTWSLMYYDRNYIDEMRMVRYAEDDNWKEVLHLAEENKQPTRTMVFLKNVALMNATPHSDHRSENATPHSDHRSENATPHSDHRSENEGGLLDRSFKLGNDAVNLNNPDSLHVTLLEIASPLVYYNYGMVNEAIRLNFENAIQAGFSPFYLKMLTRCALAVGDKKLVERYTTLLHHLPLYGNWRPAPVTAKIKELQKCYPDEITGVENSDSYIVNSISLWYSSNSKVASEQALFYAMLRCDSRRFWPALRNYVKNHMDEEFPLHAQEAYIMYMDKAPEEKRIILPITQSVYDGYTHFWDTLESLAKSGMKLEIVGEEMRKEFGDTYWWYNIFGKKYFIIQRNISHEVAS